MKIENVNRCQPTTKSAIAFMEGKNNRETRLNVCTLNKYNLDDERSFCYACMEN